MSDPKSSQNRIFQQENLTTGQMKLVRETPPPSQSKGESLPESAVNAPRDLVERLMERIKKL